MKIRSKFSFIQVYLLYGFFITILISGVYLVTRSDVMLRTKFGSTMSAAYTGLMFIVLSLSYFYFNQKYLLKIYIRDNMIIIRSLFWQRTYTVSDIQNIDLFARKNIGLLSSQRKSNGINITAYNHSYFLNDLYYSNTPEIKAAIYEAFKPVIIHQFERTYNAGSTNTTVLDSHEKFYNSFIFSPDSIAFTIAYFLLFLQYKKENPTFITCITFGLLAILILSFIIKGNYFLLSSKQLVVKNQLLWNKNIVFDVDSIANVVIEKGYKQSNTLRVNTKDFHSRTFQAGGLWSGTWRRFIQQLQTAGIEVKSDSYL